MAPPSDESTRVDDILGTPGYIAPEQIRSSASVDGRADIYALGAILFHILAHEPVVAPNAPNAVELAETGDIDPRPSRRAPGAGIAPELDAVCARALATDPDRRYPRVRDLHDAIETFLAGRRDVEMRRAIADAQTKSAEEALTAFDASKNPAESRKIALRHAAHALAVDPEHEDAGRILARLLLEPSPEALPEADAAVARENRDVLVRSGRIAGVLLLVYLLGIPFLWWSGMRDASGFVGMFGPLVVAAAVAFTFGTFPPKWLGVQVGIVSVSLAVAFGFSYGLFGAFILTPVFAQAMMTVGCNLPTPSRHRATMVGFAFLSLVGPMVFEWLGLFGRAYEYVNGDMIVHARYVPFDATSVRVALTLATVAAVLIGATISWGATSDLAEKQRALHAFAWHLRQILPESMQRDDEASRTRPR